MSIPYALNVAVRYEHDAIMSDLELARQYLDTAADRLPMAEPSADVSDRVAEPRPLPTASSMRLHNGGSTPPE